MAAQSRRSRPRTSRPCGASAAQTGDRCRCATFDGVDRLGNRGDRAVAHPAHLHLARMQAQALSRQPLAYHRAQLAELRLVVIEHNCIIHVAQIGLAVQDFFYVTERMSRRQLMRGLYRLRCSVLHHGLSKKPRWRGLPWPRKKAKGKNTKNKGSVVLGKTKTKGDAPVGRRVLATVGRTYAPRYVDPGAAADHTTGAITTLLLRGRAIRRGAFIVIMPTILDPFPYITEHVVQAPSVRFIAF